jgi:hypothetical protein
MLNTYQLFSRKATILVAFVLSVHYGCLQLIWLGVIAVHYLLSARARTLSLAAVLRMDEETAHQTLCEIRWVENGGKPFCAHCGGTEIYTYTARRIFKCKACR